jgi:hypothetical protein
MRVRRQWQMQLWCHSCESCALEDLLARDAADNQVSTAMCSGAAVCGAITNCTACATASAMNCG